MNKKEKQHGGTYLARGSLVSDRWKDLQVLDVDVDLMSNKVE